VFKPTREVRRAAAAVAKRAGISSDWLNDAAKGYFHVDPPREDVIHLSNLRVWAPTAEYMLAMKCVSARFDSHDKDDVEFLIRYLELKRPAEVFGMISRYYPDQWVPPKSRFLVEEWMARSRRQPKSHSKSKTREESARSRGVVAEECLRKNCRRPVGSPSPPRGG